MKRKTMIAAAVVGLTLAACGPMSTHDRAVAACVKGNVPRNVCGCAVAYIDDRNLVDGNAAMRAALPPCTCGMRYLDGVTARTGRIQPTATDIANARAKCLGLGA